MSIKLANESALGALRFTWQYGGQHAGIIWYEGCGAPIAELGGHIREITRPERFGWVPPKNPKQARTAVREFAQRFADQLAAEDEETQR